MATPPNPLGGAGAPPTGVGMLPTILGALANRAGTNPGQDFSQQSAALQGADPSMVNRQLDAVNQVLGVLFVKTFQTIPKLAGEISNTMKALSKAIDAAQKASSATDAIQKNEEGGGQAINFSPVQQGQPPTGDGPGMTM